MNKNINFEADLNVLVNINQKEFASIYFYTINATNSICSVQKYDSISDPDNIEFSCKYYILFKTYHQCEY